MKPDRNIFPLLAACLIAEPFAIQIHNGIGTALSLLFELKSVVLLSGFLVLCNNDPSFSMIVLILITVITFIVSMAGFSMIRYSENSPLKLAAGALLFYCGLHLSMVLLARLLMVYHSGKTSTDQAIHYFGTLQRARTIYMISNLIVILIYIFCALRIIFNYWKRSVRIGVFTYGLILSLSGALLWYCWLGRIIYSEEIWINFSP